MGENMKLAALSLIALVAFVQDVAAADLDYSGSIKDEAYPPSSAIAFSRWNGAYIGVQAGGALDLDDLSLSYNGAPVATGPLASNYNFNGVVGGIHAGYRFATQGLVLGAEADIEATGLKGSLTDALAGASASAETKINWQGSLRARAGISPTISSLLYITGGLAFAQVDDKYSLTFSSGNSFGVPAGTFGESFSDIRWGYTVGGGLEQVLTPHLATRIEYRFTDFGTYHNSSALVPGGAIDQKLQEHAVRVGLSNYF